MPHDSFRRPKSAANHCVGGSTTWFYEGCSKTYMNLCSHLGKTKRQVALGAAHFGMIIVWWTPCYKWSTPKRVSTLYLPGSLNKSDLGKQNTGLLHVPRM